ncbi:ClcB-like voltage-gated chloride channel protein [Glaciimonas sp. GG7]
MRTTLLTYRLRIQRLLHFSQSHSMLLWAVVVGFLGALATIVFREAITGLQLLLTGQSGSFVAIAKSLPWYWRVILPTAGGVVAGAILLLANRMPSPPASDYMEAVAIGDGKIPVRHSLLRSLSSLATIVSGGSIGREGSMVQLAALAASLLGRVTYFEPGRLRLLVACGAAAGITSAYNAPIAGAFFVTEIVLGAIVMESFGPIVVASVVANITMRALPGYKPAYEMPAFPTITGGEIALFVVLGILAGLAAPQFLRLLNFSKAQFQKTGLPLPWRLGLGGLIVGLMSVWVPEVWGNGYSVVNDLLHTPWVWWSVILITVAKVVATAMTIGSGAVGGVFTPTLFVGAAMGFLFGLAVHALIPGASSAPFAYAIVGMGAFLAAATSAPLMAILMIFEMTLSYQVMLPLMLSCVVAYFIARSLNGASMYNITLTRNQDAQERMRLRGIHMSDLIRPADTVLPMDAPFDEISRLFLKYPVKYIYIVNADNHYCGVVALQDITSALLNKTVDKGDTEQRVAADFLRREFLHVITPEMSLGMALELFLDHQGERLPIVRSHAEPVLLGAIFKSALLEAYFRLDSVKTQAL